MLSLLALVLPLTACEGDAAPSPSQSRPSPDTLAAACTTYREFQAFADDIRGTTISDEEVVARLADYQDDLEQDALALHRANYATVGDAALMVSKLIGHLKDAVDSFGVISSQVRSAMHDLDVASDALVAVCDT